jgi:hypothetical protein
MENQRLSRLLTLPEASRALGISSKSLRAAIRRGDLEAIQLTNSGWPRIAEADVRAWLAGRRIANR